MDRRNIYCSVKEFIGDNRLRAYASTITPDRDKEIILPDAYTEFKDVFMKNPVLLKFHDYWSESVGKIVDLTHDDFGMIMEVEFAPTEEGRKFASLYKGGYMNAFSIGFIPKEWTSPDGEDTIMMLSKYGLNKADIRRIFTSIEPLEVSCVPVPANRDAIVLQAKSFCGDDSAELDEIIEELKNIKKDTGEGINMPGDNEDVKTGDVEVTTVDENDNSGTTTSTSEDISVDDKDTPDGDGKETSDADLDNPEKAEDEEISDSLLDSLSEKLSDAVLAKVGQKFDEKFDEKLDEKLDDIVSDIVSDFELKIDDLKDFVGKEFKAVYGAVVKKVKVEQETDEEQKALKAVVDELKKLKNNEEE